MAKIKTDRLLKLATFLETIPRKKFDISDWQTEAPTKPEGKREGECGFAGCAMGWAAHAKLFRGLTMGLYSPIYKGEHGFSAADELFGFERGQFSWESDEGKFLFSGPSYPGCDPTPRQVAARIRKFVKDPSIATS